MSDPWLKFYTSDWLGEPKLKLVSRAARSLWIDMLCLMHGAGTGRLEIKGRPMTEKELAKMLGDNPRTIKKLLGELAEHDVSIVVEGSFVGSSRMIEDFKRAERDRSNGRKGGNPTLKIRESGEDGVNPEVKAQKPEARSQSKEKEDKSSSSLRAEAAADFENYLKAHPKPIGSPDEEAAFSALVEAGEDPKQIIASAAAYAETVKSFSDRKMIQQSDNFLNADYGKWRKHIPTPAKAKATEGDQDAFWAGRINDGKYIHPGSIPRDRIERLVSAGLVTLEKMEQQGISA